MGAGRLPAGILSVLAVESLHGYSIAAALERRGLGRPQGGSLYPILAQLEVADAAVAAWSEGESGPGRRVYQLTPLGRNRLAEEVEQWAGLVGALGVGVELWRR